MAWSSVPHLNTKGHNKTKIQTNSVSLFINQSVMITINCVKGFVLTGKLVRIITYEHIISWDPYKKMSKRQHFKLTPKYGKSPHTIHEKNNCVIRLIINM